MPEDLTLQEDPTAPGNLMEGGNITTLQHNRITKRLGGTAQLAGSRAIQTDADGKLQASAVTAVELAFLAGVASAIQSQLDGKQPQDTDLTAIAGLTAVNDDIIQRKAGAWTNRTLAQLKTDLALLLANITDVTITVANLNSLDDGVNSTLHFHDSDRARANHTGTQLKATISDFAHTHPKSEVDDAGAWLDSEIPNLDTSKITTGQFPMARLASGVPDGTKFIRDDGVLATPPGGSGTDEVLLIPTANKTIPANSSIIVGAYYELGAGIELTVNSGANLTVA